MKNKIILYYFKQFLIQNKIYTNIINNYNICAKDILSIIEKKQTMKSVFVCLFVWADSKEQDNFWINICLKWYDYYNNNIEPWIEKF